MFCYLSSWLCARLLIIGFNQLLALFSQLVTMSSLNLRPGNLDFIDYSALFAYVFSSNIFGYINSVSYIFRIKSYRILLLFTTYLWLTDAFRFCALIQFIPAYSWPPIGIWIFKFATCVAQCVPVLTSVAPFSSTFRSLAERKIFFFVVLFRVHTKYQICAYSLVYLLVKLNPRAEYPVYILFYSICTLMVATELVAISGVFLTH